LPGQIRELKAALALLELNDIFGGTFPFRLQTKIVFHVHVLQERGLVIKKGSVMLILVQIRILHSSLDEDNACCSKRLKLD